MAIDLIASEYGWTDDYILDRTIDRISMAVRYINKRLRMRFVEQAKLLEAATRHIAAFASQSEKGPELASKIELLPWDDLEPDKPRLPAEYPDMASDKPKKLILPPGVSREDVKQEPKEVGSLRFDQRVEDLQDVSERKVTPAVPEDRMNRPGSFESLMTRLGQMKGS